MRLIRVVYPVCITDLTFQMYPIYLIVYLSVCLPVYLLINRSIDPSLCFSLRLNPSVYLSMGLALSSSAEISLRGRLGFWITTSEKKQIYRRSQFLKLATWKAQQFCETSFNNENLSAELMASYQCAWDFPIHVSTVLRTCHENWDQVIHSAVCVEKNHYPTLLPTSASRCHSHRLLVNDGRMGIVLLFFCDYAIVTGFIAAIVISHHHPHHLNYHHHVRCCTFYWHPVSSSCSSWRGAILHLAAFLASMPPKKKNKPGDTRCDVWL